MNPDNRVHLEHETLLAQARAREANLLARYYARHPECVYAGPDAEVKAIRDRVSLRLAQMESSLGRL
jgi:hypothetical protein